MVKCQVKNSITANLQVKEEEARTENVHANSAETLQHFAIVL